jgi:hypothetical protein
MTTLNVVFFIVMLSAIILNHIFIVVMLGVFKLSVIVPLLTLTLEPVL